MARPRGGAATLEGVTGEAGGQPAEPGAGQEPAAAPELPVLPTKKSTAASRLEDKTVVLYGPPKIGKSTLGSEWDGGRLFFFDCAGELGDLEVYRLPCGDWTEFRATAASYVAEMAKPEEDRMFSGCAIDTADIWAQMCAANVRRKLGIVHESDADWGKGWSMVKEELQLRLARLMATPGGVLLISHSKELEIKPKRGAAYTRFVPTLAGGVRDVVVNAADLILFVDWAEDGESRVIYTKPDPSFEAGERGQKPRLPAEIEWPVGRSGWEVLKEAWDGQA